jgi:hypothetical protein
MVFIINNEKLAALFIMIKTFWVKTVTFKNGYETD